MKELSGFSYTPSEHEAEKASNSYLMSLVAAVAGLPLPIVNLIATAVFYLGNRKGTYFVRWHCTQALVSQLSMFCINAPLVWWTVGILFGDLHVNNAYIAYVIVAFIFNISEFIATIYSAVQTRKGKHLSWWFYGPLTDVLCKA